MPLESSTEVASDAMVGIFNLPSYMVKDACQQLKRNEKTHAIERLGTTQNLFESWMSSNQFVFTHISAEEVLEARPAEENKYQNASNRIGSLRCSWRYIPAENVTILGVQRVSRYYGKGYELEKYEMEGISLPTVHKGSLSSRKIVNDIISSEQKQTWVFHFFLWLSCFLGHILVLQPSVELIMMIPFACQLLSAGFKSVIYPVLFLWSVAICFSVLTVSNLIYRPKGSLFYLVVVALSLTWTYILVS